MDHRSLTFGHLSYIFGSNTICEFSRAAGAGALVHLALLKNLEVEFFMYQFLVLYLISPLLLGTWYLLMGLTAQDTLIRVTAITVGFTSGVFIRILIYRAFFHRLRRFPGPFLAKITRFHALYVSARHSKYHEEVSNMHEQCGSIVRIGPRELSVLHQSAIAPIYGPMSKCRKATWYSHKDIDPKRCSLHTTRDHHDHRRRRKAWDRGLAVKVLKMYEPRIKQKVDLYISRVSYEEAVDATDWSMYLAFDIIGDTGLGTDFGCLARGAAHPAIQEIHDHMEILEALSHVPWLMNLISRITSVTVGYPALFKLCALEIEAKLQNLQSNERPQDIVSSLLEAFVENDVSAPPSIAALHEDSHTIIAAGSETVATTLAAILYYLAKHPVVTQKLQSQIDAVMPTPRDYNYDKMKLIPYVDDIINEALRLKPPVLLGGPRVTPPDGIRIDKQYIPGDVIVSIPVQKIQTDERYWKQGSEFIPERFSERRAELGTDDAPFLPFSLGAYACIGKNMAMMSLRIATCCIAQEFNVVFAPGEDGETFDKGAKCTFTTTAAPLKIRFLKRAQASPSSNHSEAQNKA